MKVERAVIDTNVLISAALVRTTAPAALVNWVLQRGCILFSESTFAEFESRLWRPKFDRYLTIELRNLLLHDLRAVVHWVDAAALGAVSARRYSRDADDDKFVHVALAGAADMIVSGDRDLLLLHPVNGLPVLSPADALRAFAAGSM